MCSVIFIPNNLPVFKNLIEILSGRYKNKIELLIFSTDFLPLFSWFLRLAAFFLFFHTIRFYLAKIFLYHDARNFQSSHQHAC